MTENQAPQTPVELFTHTKHYNESEGFLHKLDPDWGLLALRLRALEPKFLKDGVSGRTAKRILKTHQYLENFRKRLSTGHTLSILHAVRFCAQEGMPLPSWLTSAFVEQTDRYMNPDHSRPLYDLNDCFYSEAIDPSLASKRKTVARDQRAGLKFWVAVQAVVAKNLHISSVNQAITLCLADKSWGFAKTKAKQLFKQVEDAQIALLPNYQGLSHLLAKRRHK
jgi:hypothetical protein